MPAQRDATSAARVDDAIVRVLQAEQAARTAVEAYAVQAERIREESRLRARTIAERAAERVARAHGLTDAGIRARIAALNDERAALLDTAADPAEETARLQRALHRLATELAGGAE